LLEQMQISQRNKSYLQWSGMGGIAHFVVSSPRQATLMTCCVIDRCHRRTG